MARLNTEPGQITAVLGPTNTGKTHLALTRMMAHVSGVIGLPLRLLAREIYDKVVKVKGAPEVLACMGFEDAGDEWVVRDDDVWQRAAAVAAALKM